MLKIKNNFNCPRPLSMKKSLGEWEELFVGNFSPMMFNICVFVSFYSTIQLINYSTNPAAQKFSLPRAGRIFQGQYSRQAAF
ncbi:hypothetical protein [Caldithrix abyssi]